MTTLRSTCLLIIAQLQQPLFFTLLLCLLVLNDTVCSFSVLERTRRPSFLIIGGTGKIGTAVADHLLLHEPNAEIYLVGRQQNFGSNAINELLQKYPKANISYRYGDFNQEIPLNEKILKSWIEQFQCDDSNNVVDCIIHTAGPYADCQPNVLKAAIAAKVPVYVDVADPLPYLERGVLMKSDTTTALLAAGAFPGMSNVLGIETAKAVTQISGNERVKDIRFNYFTAGLGGSGTINLYITNIGFGEAMGVYDDGSLRFFSALSGLLLGTVDFFLPTDKVTAEHGFGNDKAKERVGTKQVFAWPFPEAATVASNLKIRGNSCAAMGTAPDIWNSMLGILVTLIPRSWWRNTKFSKFMADFSEPLVLVTDQLLKLNDVQGIGETHAMRIDVQSVDEKITMSTIQCHDSFRQCVGQSCAEFALDCLQYPSQPGVYLTEQRYEDDTARARIIKRLTSTPGTFCYTGPVRTDEAQPKNLQTSFDKAALADFVPLE